MHNATRPRRRFSGLRNALLVVALLGGTLLALDRAYPVPTRSWQRQAATVVVAADGRPLRSFADDQGVWRYPVLPEQVAPHYLTALLNYEDRWFYAHPGVNPVALLRAGWQWLRHGRIISGGSTLTMQVARLLEPRPRTLGGKFQQVLRALQLEWHHDKREILALYLNHAPFGGPLEGVQAASFAYLGKSAAVLSPAEAALLAVLPQAPTRLRPDRHPAAAQAARDKVLRRLHQRGVWDARTFDDALVEPVVVSYQPQPWLAPHLSARVKSMYPDRSVIATTVDSALQWSVETKLRSELGRWPPHTSAAVLVVDNVTLEVRAYAGSADFFANDRDGQVDMITATRSPGSTLKPFLYAFALEDGLIHSESLLSDVPRDFGSYQPANFSDTFNGPVSAREALQRSLNVPAVDVLDHVGSVRFAARLRQAGIRLNLGTAQPNLAMILGGAGASLEDLVVAYAGLANGGVTGPLRMVPASPAPSIRFADAGAAWIVRDILQQQPAPGMARAFESDAPRRLAWKTGTSYGFRDAWALGFNDRYTIGVWVGRPDGTPSPGAYGAITAAPLLFGIADALPRHAAWNTRVAPPDNVRMTDVCWPTGMEWDSQHAALCHVRRKAWILNDTVPPTWPEREQGIWRNGVVKVAVNSRTGQRVAAQCEAQEMQLREVAVWPLALEPWLPRNWRRSELLPAWDARCQLQASASEGALRIAQQPDVLTLHRAGAAAVAPALTLTAVGANRTVYWLVNGRLAQSANAAQSFTQRFYAAGEYTVTVMDREGYYDSRVVRVLP